MADKRFSKSTLLILVGIGILSIAAVLTARALFSDTAKPDPQTTTAVNDQQEQPTTPDQQQSSGTATPAIAEYAEPMRSEHPLAIAPNANHVSRHLKIA